MKPITNPYIKKYWVIENSSSQIHKVLNPMIGDGHLEIVFIEGNGVSFKFDDQSFSLSSGIYFTGHLKVVGQVCLFEATKMHFFKLYPWANQLVTDFSFSELSNSLIPLSELNHSLTQKLKDFKPTSQIEEILRSLLVVFDDTAKWKQDFNTIKIATEQFAQSEVSFSTQKRKLLTDLRISDRTLEKKFKQHIGLTPKQFSMTIKMRKIVEDLIYERSSSSLTHVAFDYGFFDQSHFIRSFKSLFGKSPRQVELNDYFIPNSEEPFRYYTI